MGKGKKKTKGKKRSGGKKEKVREETSVDGFSTWMITLGQARVQITQEHIERAREAAANRTEDPLKNWTRLQNEECPICMLPMPFACSEIKYWGCCGKMICWGCIISSGIVHAREGEDVEKAMKTDICPFCREDHKKCTSENEVKRAMKQAETGERDEMQRIGQYYCRGEMGLQQDKAEGLRWYHRAVEAGSGLAAFNLGGCYLKGDGVEQDLEKALGYFQKAAELGGITAFNLIGFLLMVKGEIEDAMLNYRKAAICGDSNEHLFGELKEGFVNGYITKEEYAYTLREHQKACNEMKSDARESWKIMLSEGVLQRAGGM